MSAYRQIEKEALALAKEKGGEDYESFVLAVETAPEISKLYAEMFFDFVVVHSKELNARKEA